MQSLKIHFLGIDRVYAFFFIEFFIKLIFYCALFLIIFTNVKYTLINNQNKTRMRTNHRFFLYSNFLLPKREWLLALVVMLMATFSVSAQNEKIITGVVASATDALPLPGVNIVVKGTSKTANTDFEGKFSIQASSDDVLVF